MNDFMERTVRGLRLGAFACVLGLATISPWCFGSWEMWWFWPMATLLFFGALLAGLGELLSFAIPADSYLPDGKEPRLRFERSLAAILLVSAPFLLYALWRSSVRLGPEIPYVEMESERSLLLMFTPVLLLIIVFLTATKRRIRILAVSILVNAAVVSLYAIANHFITRDVYVLWVVTPFGYGGRAAGVYFCPNHLAAHINIALAIVAALTLTRKVAGRTKLLLLLMALPMLAAWFLTLSRGGIGSFILIAPLLIVPGLRGYPWKRRIISAVALALLFGGAIWGVIKLDNPLIERIKGHNLTRVTLEEIRKPEMDRQRIKRTFLTGFDRGMYIDAALRAWRSSPRIGIGPGQHAIRWPEFAATEDGDRAENKRPTLTNHTYFLYEVHSDWVQLLEEYGSIGLALFLIPCLAAFAMLLRAQGKALRGDAPELEQALPLAAFFALAVFCVHSIGDFSLQIPAIVWILAALAGCGLAAGLPEKVD